MDSVTELQHSPLSNTAIHMLSSTWFDPLHEGDEVGSEVVGAAVGSEVVGDVVGSEVVGDIDGAMVGSEVVGEDVGELVGEHVTPQHSPAHVLV